MTTWSVELSVTEKSEGQQRTIRRTFRYDESQPTSAVNHALAEVFAGAAEEGKTIIGITISTPVQGR